MAMIGNIIFHAFYAPYVEVCFAPWLILMVLAVEAAILWAWNQTHQFFAVVSWVAGMNAASFVVGFVVGPWLLIGGGLTVLDPDESGIGRLAIGPEWHQLARLAFLQAWAVSSAIELAAMLAVRRWSRLSRVVLPVVVGNAASHAILYGGFLLTFGRMGASTG